MSWRVVVVKSRSKLDYKLDYLVIRTEDKTSRVHLSEIAVLLIESTAVSLTAYLLSELTKQKIKVIFCDEKCNPQSELLPLYGSHDTSRKIREQIRWNEEVKKLIWAEIVRAKIQGQLSNLPPACADERSLLSAYMREIEPGDTTNREGHAAKVYFHALFGKDFSRSDENVTNAALNYGYSILLSAFNREVVASGYLTQLGIAHDNVFNPFNLSCDLMEPFRPFVDRLVLDSAFTVFEHEQKMKMVDILNMQIVMGGQNPHLLHAIKLYTASVFHAIEERDIALIKKPYYEL